jgi:hypothetical protein
MRADGKGDVGVSKHALDVVDVGRAALEQECRRRVAESVRGKQRALLGLWVDEDELLNEVVLGGEVSRHPDYWG